jgi:sulfatase modifying factor 1
MPLRGPCLAVLLFLVLSCREREQERERVKLLALPSASASAQKGSSIQPPDAPPEPRKGMVFIPGGALVAGTPPDAFPRLADEEIPGEQFILNGFYIDVFPYPNEEGAIPLTNVTQAEAAALCAEKSKRLCTELEWERACKGPSNRAYEYGDRADACATGSQPILRPSGLRVACRSDFGVRDLHGGAFEWTSSRWTRRDATGLVTVRGGNGVHGELVGRCANGQGRPPGERSGSIGFRCCAGPENTAEVSLLMAHARKLEPRVSIDRGLTAKLLEAMPESARTDLVGKGQPSVDRLWSWWPAGNDELVIGSVCAGMGQRPGCGVMIARMSLGRPHVLEWVSSGYWAATLHPEYDPRDVWLVGGDELGPFKRLISYVWGKLRIGPKERRIPKASEQEKKREKKKKK